MNILKNIADTQERIPHDYRKNTSIDKIKDDLDDLDIKEITNPHIFNLISLLNPIKKEVVSIEISGKKHTMDLEIDDKSHSYYANGTPVHNTINIPQNYSYDKFKDVYLNAYKSKYIKGVTTYRAGTMATVLAAKDETSYENGEEIIKEDVKLPTSSSATVKTLKEGGRKWYLTVTYHEDNVTRPFALFVHTNNQEKGVTTNDAVDRLLALARKKKIPKRHIDSTIEKIEQENNVSKLARSISFLLRHGVLIKNIVAELDKVEDIFIGSFLFQIKKFLASYIKDGDKVEDEVCYNCSSTNIIYSEGCKKCNNCGSSKCG